MPHHGKQEHSHHYHHSILNHLTHATSISFRESSHCFSAWASSQMLPFLIVWGVTCFPSGNPNCLAPSKQQTAASTISGDLSPRSFMSSLVSMLSLPPVL